MAQPSEGTKPGRKRFVSKRCEECGDLMRWARGTDKPVRWRRECSCGHADEWRAYPLTHQPPAVTVVRVTPKKKAPCRCSDLPR